MFEIVSPTTLDHTTVVNSVTEHLAHSNIEAANPKATDGGRRRVVLPRRWGQPRFGPPPYYYEASRTGVLPSGCSASERCLPLRTEARY
jgi:hypothetical protein